MKQLPFTLLPNLHLALLVRHARICIAQDNLIAARARARIQLDQLRREAGMTP